MNTAAHTSLRWLLLALSLQLSALSLFAQTAKSRATLYTDLDTVLADTGDEPITPADIRTLAKDIIASSQNASTDGTAATLAGANTFTGANSFTLAPRTARTDLAGGTALALGTYYYDTLSADRALTFSGTPAEGTLVGVKFTVTGAARTVTIPSSKRMGQTDVAITSIEFTPGIHQLVWVRWGGEWLLFDTAAQQISGDQITAGTVADARIAATIARDDEVDNDISLALASLSGVYQLLDSDLTAIAALTTTSYGRSLLTVADAAAARTTLGLVIGTNVQAYDADLTTYAGITPAANVQSLLGAANYAAIRALLDLEAGTDFLAYPTGTPTGSKYLRDDNTWQTISGGGDALTANPLTQFSGILPTNTEFNYVDGVTSSIQTQLDGKQPLDSDLTAIAALTTTSFGRGLLDEADAAAARSTLGLVIGTNVQAYDADLTTYAGITPSANIQSLLGSADYAAARSNLGLAIGSNVQAWDADLDALAALSGTNNLYYRSASNTWSSVTIGSGLTFSSGTLSASGGGGWTTGVLFTTGSTTAVIDNSSSETSIFSGPITGGTLGTAGKVRFVLSGQFLNDSGSTQGFTLRIKYGATTMYADASGATWIANSGTRRTWRIEGTLFSDGTTGTQRVEFRYENGNGVAATTGYGDASGASTASNLAFVGGGTSSEDSTADKTLDITIQLTAANASYEWYTYQGFAQKL